MKTRAARIDDLQALLALRCALWPQLEIGVHEQALRTRLATSVRHHTLVLESADGTLCGFAEMSVDSPADTIALATSVAAADDRARLNALYITPPMRAAGGSELLLEAAQRWAHGRGAQSLYCDLPLDDADAVQQLEKLGFAQGRSWVRSTLPISGALEIARPKRSLVRHT